MRMSTAAFLMILTTVFLSGCAQDRTMAAVEDHSKSTGGMSRVATYQPDAAVMDVSARALPAPVAPAQSQPQVEAQKKTYVRYVETANWQWPVSGTVTEKFGPQRAGVANQGITIAAAEGAVVRAAKPGEVAFIGNQVRNYGNMVILRHADGTLSAYSHLRDVAVKKGDKVAGGSVIAHVGRTGTTGEPQLHFAIREGEQAIDPLSKLPQQVAAN